MQPITPGNFGYSVLRAAAHAGMFSGLMDYCAGFRMPLEGLHCETGPGVWEAALAVADGLEAADRATLFKTFSKAFFQHRELMATFMAKWSMDYPGQSGHYHFSMLDAEGRNAFAGPDVPDLARWALGGLVHFVPEFLCLLAPTVNSYTRLVKGAWAPTASTWGVDNRTAAFRFIAGDDKSQHIECRVGGADGNPYLVAAATIGAALLGIERRIEPPQPIAGNGVRGGGRRRAGVAFRTDPARCGRPVGRIGGGAGVVRGHVFVEHFVTTRLWESREAERHVNDWQLGRYFEIV